MRPAHSPALDGIRAIAVAFVFFYHTHMPFAGAGFIGVTMFFALSGFLITRLLLLDSRVIDTRSYGQFTLRRLARLYPALLVTLFLSALIWRSSTALVPFSEVLLPALLFYSNWIIAERGFAAMDPLAPLWSLAIEVQFYLLWPWLLKMLMPFRPKGAALIAVVWVLLLGAAKAYGDAVNAQWAEYTATLSYMDVLLLGSIAAIVELERLGSAWLWRVLGPLSAIGLCVLCVLGEGPAAAVWYQYGHAVVAVLTVLFIAAMLHEPDSALSRLCGSEPLASLGRISYGVYLFHYPILSVTAVKLRPLLSNEPLLFASRVALTLLLAWLSYRYVERPIRDAVRHRSRAELREEQQPAGAGENRRGHAALRVHPNPHDRPSPRVDSRSKPAPRR